MNPLVKNFDFNTFEAQWETLAEDEKSAVIDAAADLTPSLAILPILAGITSYHFSVRNSARKGLGIIQSTLTSLLSDPADKVQRFKGMKESACVCARIFALVNPDLSFTDASFLLKTLLSFEYKGADFAFKALYNGLVTIVTMEKIISTVPESGRLAFVDQYLHTSPGVRLKFGFPFKRILKSIQHRQPVVAYYAGLFDRQRDADPFLNNIHPELRDPDQIIANEIQSSSPQTKIMGLKALAMTVTKMPSDLLVDILSSEQGQDVRLAVYAVVEHSSIGEYPELFHPILEQFKTCVRQEAFLAFKALVVTGKLPLHALLEIVRKQYPTLMPDIHIEISTLSRISFFFIQDIALNRKKYLDDNFEVNLACVLGMIKKRPERVVKLLKHYDNHSKDSLRMDVTRFMEKTKQLFQQERKSIETQFDPVLERIKKESKKPVGVIKSLFTGSVKKKIEDIKTHAALSPVCFENQTITDADLSSFDFSSTAFFFTGCILDDCNLSGSGFLTAYFKSSIFHNINMQKARFDRSNFDNACFINVNAQGAVFKNCSFQNISMYNCNFNGADLKDAFFLDSIVSKTAFNQTDLSGVCFAYSHISAVSFLSANINQADFSGVVARFCRFPTSTKPVIKTRDMDYNARKFQLSFNDMPRMDTAIVAEINMLIFCEFIHYGEMKFLKQNQLSLLTAFDIFKSKQADLFQVIPFLLHENPRFPGLGPIPEETPHGICDYVPGPETLDVIKKYMLLENTNFKRSQTHVIEGLFTIGSTGSIAQTSDSDIDYWVCINEKNFSFKGLELFRKKLKMLEKMAGQEFNTKVTFFLVDIFKAKNNDFGESTVESSGTAQTRLLKEEFYRTMIYVAGKIPFWSVLPTSISVHYYSSILKNVSRFPDLMRYIDLGDIHAISTSEYFGASIWQMFKWLKSPFKSVIKISLLEKYMHEYGRQSLLCNKYKDEWMNSGSNLKLAQNDSYYILLKNLIHYYRTVRDEPSAKLLLTCFFLKLGVSKDAQLENTVFGLRKTLIEKCIARWGLTRETVFEIGSFHAWQYNQIAKLSATIERYMIKKYKTINLVFERQFHGQPMISPEDRTVLGRKVLVEFSKQPGKVGKVLLISKSNRHFQGLHLRHIKTDRQMGTWELFNKNTRALDRMEEPLIKADTIEEIGAWLMNNHLYDEDSVINLIPNPTYVTFDDIRKLYKTMDEFFRPVLDSVISFDRLLTKSKMVCLFISINFYAPKQQRKVTEYTAVYLNSWGEMFCKSFCPDQGFSTMEEVKKDILTRTNVKKMPLNTAFYFSKGVVR